MKLLTEEEIKNLTKEQQKEYLASLESERRKQVNTGSLHVEANSILDRIKLKNSERSNQQEKESKLDTLYKKL